MGVCNIGNGNPMGANVVHEEAREFVPPVVEVYVVFVANPEKVHKDVDIWFAAVEVIAVTVVEIIVVVVV